MERLNETLKDPRFVRGITMLKEKRYEEAVVHFEDLLRTMIEIENKGDSLQIAPVYYEYGNALLSYAEATASVFGKDTEKGEDGQEEESDLEVAWEMLEVSRIILTNHEGEDPGIDKELARVYMRLGDISMESDSFQQARSDYEKSLAIQQKHLVPLKMDTTALADIYCCMAITCIYEHAKQNATDNQEEETKTEEASTPKLTQEEMEFNGLKYYVNAGQVMIDNIYRQSEVCSERIQAFVKKHIPLPLELAKAGSNGKAKSKANAFENLLLDYYGEYEVMRRCFLECANAGREDTDPTSDDDQRLLLDEEKKILEYLEIYTELKEKVDGLRESHKAKVVSPAPVTTIGFGTPASKPESSTTVIGFGQTSTNDKSSAVASEAATSQAEASVNVLPVTKKRKITPSQVTETK